MHELARAGIRHDNVLNDPYAGDLADALVAVIEEAVEGAAEPSAA